MNKYLIAVGFNQNGFQQVEVQRLHTGSGTAFHLWHAFEDSSAEWLREPCINSTTDFGKLSSSARPSTSCLDSLFCTINWTRSPTILLDGVTDWPPCKLFWRPRTGCPVLANRPGTGGSCTGRRGSRWGRRRRCPISSWRNTRLKRSVQRPRLFSGTAGCRNVFLSACLPVIDRDARPSLMFIRYWRDWL